ncbi:MAG: DEAD/DEAH box helicase [Candidatus Riflebacteria bacterium]|nr:DEAD/DEAH box helicase [Candidatus Riflebacteria bacterium]
MTAESQAIQEQIERRRERALLESFKISKTGQRQVLTDFDVASPSGRSYRVRIRSVKERTNGCTCPDFRTNLLGTCKHVEAVLEKLRTRHRSRLASLAAAEEDRARIFLWDVDEPKVRLTPTVPPAGVLGQLLARFFDADGVLLGDPLERFELLARELELLPGAASKGAVTEDEIAPVMAELRERRNRERRRTWFLEEVQAGRRSLDVISARLYDYQQQGMLHLALGGRALLADDMGLGKTVQAIAAATLLRELKGIQKALVVTPASLKHQWERELKRFTSLPVQVIRSAEDRRDLIYAQPAFFTVVNYELLLRERWVYQKLGPDLVILDEAQRIKNWRTKTAQAVKELTSPYAFVLSGTPLENNLDELYSVMQFLDPRLLGPLWKFNSQFYVLEKRKSGHFKVLGHQNLRLLRERISPVVMRRTRDEVLDQLPDRTDNTYFVELTKRQLEPYSDYLSSVSRLVHLAEKRPLTPDEVKRLLMCLQKMRIISDALALHDARLSKADILATSPKLGELGRILGELVVGTDRKALVFSSFEGMIDLAIRHVIGDLKLGHEKLAGSVPTQKRSKLLERFREDPACKVLFSTDAGGVGLNLQEASLVINLDVPWNPAVLEQRIGRAHRLGQKRSVQVVNLVTSASIEERMLDGIANKRQLFAAVFDGTTDVDELRFDRTRGLLARVREMLAPAVPPVVDAEVVAVPEAPALPAGEAGSVAAAAGPGGLLALPAAPPAETAPGAPRPEQPSAEAPRLLAAALADRLGGHLLMMRRWTRPGDRTPSLLLIVDGEAESLRPTAEAALVALTGAETPPPLHLFDRQTYRSLVGLLGPGMETAQEELWRAPSLPRLTEPVQDQRRVEAGKALEEAGARMRLARLMSENGFAADAFAPLGQAVDAALKALLVFHGAPAGAAPGDLAAIERHLVAPGLLRPETSARIAWLRGVGAQAELLGKAMDAATQIVSEAGEGLRAPATGS